MDEVEGAGWVAGTAGGSMALESTILAWLSFGTLGDDAPLLFAINISASCACDSRNTTRPRFSQPCIRPLAMVESRALIG